MKKITAMIIWFLWLLVIPQVSLAGQVTLAWDRSTSMVTGYKIYWGTVSRTYSDSADVGDTDHCTLDNLVEGETYYFAATAYNDDIESDYSNEASAAITLPIVWEDGTGNANWKRMKGLGSVQSVYDGDYYLAFSSTGATALSVFKLDLVNVSYVTDNWITWDYAILQPTNSYFVITVNTTFGQRTLYYKFQTGNLVGTSSITFGLDPGLKDGEWHDFNRDLQADIANQPGNNWLSTVSVWLYVYGMGASVDLDNLMTYSTEVP